MHKCYNCNWEGDFKKIKLVKLKKYGRVAICPNCEDIMYDRVDKIGSCYVIETDRSVYKPFTELNNIFAFDFANWSGPNDSQM